MWFKNLRIYRLTDSFDYSPEDLNDLLQAHEFQPCGSLDPVKYGWTCPLGRHGTELVHAANGYIMVCAKRQEKIIPSSVVNEELEERVLAIQADENRFVGRKEKQTIKDEVIFDLLPKALTKSSLDFAYIDPKENLIVVNVGSSSRAENLLSALREALGALKVIPLTPYDPPPQVMTGWLKDMSTPKDFEIGEECELTSIKEGRVIKCKNQELTAEEILALIDSGMVVNKLAVNWKDAIQFIIDDQLAIKRIKYEDSIQEKLDDHSPETAAEQFDIEFSIMTVELSALIKALIKAFGGVADE